MARLRVRTGGILAGGDDLHFIPNGSLQIENGRIERILTDGEAIHGDTVADLRGKIAIPGFIQTHVHLCQTDARGLGDNLPLMDWLKNVIYPFEHKLTADSLRRSCRRGIEELLLSGTTCILDMGTMHHTEVIAEELDQSGIRAYFGKCLVDTNGLLPDFREDATKAIQESAQLAKKWHGHESRLRYAISPRFILSCSDRLMADAVDFLVKYPGTLLHTHASESPEEMGHVRRLDQMRALTDRSVIAHCVHLDDGEIARMAERKSAIAHCPSANLKLASGIADIVSYRRQGVRVSLGSDGAACNNHLDMWTEMRLAALLPRLKHGADAISAKDAFQMATLEGARALHWDDEIGSLEEGKSADITFVDLGDVSASTDAVLSSLVYSGRPDRVTDVMVAGRWVVREFTKTPYS